MQSAKKLFYQDQYLKNTKAKVLKILPYKSTFGVICDKTVFYPKGGGQPGDKGSISNQSSTYNIIDTIKHEDKANQTSQIIHLIENNHNLEVGQEVDLSLDWDFRYKMMKFHSSMHLLCSLIKDDITGGNISSDSCHIDFNFTAKKPDKVELSQKINDLIARNLKITYQEISAKELEIRKNLIRTVNATVPLTGGLVRLILIDEGRQDIQPCGGTHVLATSEIDKIKVAKIESKGKNNQRVKLVFDN